MRVEVSKMGFTIFKANKSVWMLTRLRPDDKLSEEENIAKSIQWLCEHMTLKLTLPETPTELVPVTVRSHKKFQPTLKQRKALLKVGLVFAE